METDIAASSLAVEGVLSSSTRKERASSKSEGSIEGGGVLDCDSGLLVDHCRGGEVTVGTGRGSTGEREGERRAGNMKFGATVLCKRAKSASAHATGSRLDATGDGGEGGRGM